MSVDCSFKSLTSAHANELLQSHNSLTFKLLKTVADFSQALADLHDKFGQQLQVLVETFRKRNGELRKERLQSQNSLYQIWELFLQQVEVNSQQHGDLSRNFSQHLGSGLIERVFHRKIQSKKIFAHRESIEMILFKSSELLLKCYNDYCRTYRLVLTNPAEHMSEYIASHNRLFSVYVHQLQATNGMIHAYQTKTLPSLLEELEECHLETSQSISTSILEASEFVSEKSNEQLAGFQVIASACRQANHRQDLVQFVRAGELTNGSACTSQESDNESIVLRYHQFQGPRASDQHSDQVNQRGLVHAAVPSFKNEIAHEPGQPDAAEQQPKLEKDRERLEEKIERLKERLEQTARQLSRSLDSRLYNKVNDLQEELSQRRFELFMAEIHLAAVRSQLQLFEYNYRPANQSNRPPFGPSNPALNSSLGSNSSTGEHHLQLANYKNKWLKALKSLQDTKSSASSAAANPKLIKDESYALDSGSSQVSQQQLISSVQLASHYTENQHFFQEYTFKKIASCDVCKDFLRGHMRQGLKCKLCRISCHSECQSKAHTTIKCQQPKIKLLRRQKSAGELDITNCDIDSVAADNSGNEPRLNSSKPDGIYQLIRQVLEAKRRGNQNPLSQPQVHSQPQNLQESVGRLTLPKQGTKSASTSALVGPDNNSVDRWAVVMDLLAESRKKEREQMTGESSLPGKRSSKQLDKFKSAAKSAAAASRHQRDVSHLIDSGQNSRQHPSVLVESSSPHPQQQRWQQQHLPVRMRASSPTPSISCPDPESQQQQQLQSAGSRVSGYQRQLGVYDHSGTQDIFYGEQSASRHSDTAIKSSAHQTALLHQTRSLPVDQQSLSLSVSKQSSQQTQVHFHQSLHYPNAIEVVDPILNLSRLDGQPESPGPSQQASHQLLSISDQQLQSTSAPHSPKRKRFSLRMKSFSLDSPDSPVVSECPLDSAANQQLGGHSSDGNATTYQLDNSEIQQQQQKQPIIYSSNQLHSHNQPCRPPDYQAVPNLICLQKTEFEASYPHPGDPHPSNLGSQHLFTNAQRLHTGSYSALDSVSYLDQHKALKQASSDNPLNDDYYCDRPTSPRSVQPYEQQSSRTFVVLYDYAAQRPDELELVAGQLVSLLNCTSPDWWEVRTLDRSDMIGFFPSCYLAMLYSNEHPVRIAQTIQVSNGENCDKLLRGQIVIHTGQQIENLVGIRLAVSSDQSQLQIKQQTNKHHIIQCPKKYLIDIGVPFS